MKRPHLSARVLFRFFFIHMSLVLLISCSRAGEPFSFYIEAENASVKERPARKAKQEDLFLPVKGGFETSRFYPQRPVTIEEGKTFYITYSSPHTVTIEISAGKKDSIFIELPRTGGVPRKQFLPLEPGSSFKWFRLSAREQGAAITAAGIDPDIRGIVFTEEEERVGSLFSTAVFDLFGDRVRIIEWAEPLRAGDSSFKPDRFLMSYSYCGKINGLKPVPFAVLGPPAETEEKSQNGRSLQRGEIFPLGKNQKIYFLSNSLGFSPERLEIVLSGGFQIESLLFEEDNSVFLDPLIPILSDFSAILDYNPEFWRRPEFELFSWSFAPAVLIFDFRDFDVQADFLKRLAFFVEKKSYAGRIPSQEEIRRLHGWNAHDYRAYDLARFFDMAINEGIPLNREETLLLEILIANGIVLEKEGRISEGEGAILSVARSSSPRLRRVFLNHEGYHGLFFSDPVFAERVTEVFEGLSDMERQFWVYFLDSMNYNTEDQYLLINEFQAYLLQQPVAEADSYYWGYLVPQLKTRKPGTIPFLDELSINHPETFRETARRLENLLLELYGFYAFSLLPRTPYLFPQP